MEDAEGEVNYFEYASAADRYARGRPFFHPLVAERVKRTCCLERRLARALDVGCGTGQSTQPLTELAESVVGLDASSAMLAHTQRRGSICYVAGRAEALPFASKTFDALVVGLAFHWFDRGKFLAEAQRVLHANGWLVLFDDYFSGEMTGNEDYARWNKEHHAKRFPAPPRNRTPFSDSAARAHGFEPRSRERFTHAVAFSPEQLVAYLTTQTNVIAAEARGEDIDSIEAWLAASTRPLFRSATEQFPFTCVLDIFQRQGQD